MSNRNIESVKELLFFRLIESRLTAGGGRLGWGVLSKKEKKENNHGHRQQCGDFGGGERRKET